MDTPVHLGCPIRGAHCGHLGALAIDVGTIAKLGDASPPEPPAGEEALLQPEVDPKMTVCVCVCV